jgi:hypothetical protein
MPMNKNRVFDNHMRAPKAQKAAIYTDSWNYEMEATKQRKEKK